MVLEILLLMLLIWPLAAIFQNGVPELLAPALKCLPSLFLLGRQYSIKIRWDMPYYGSCKRVFMVGTGLSCTIPTPGAHRHHCSHVALVTCRTAIAISVPPCTHLHLSEVKHLRIKCLAQEHNIDTTISQCSEGRNMIFLWKSCT